MNSGDLGHHSLTPISRQIHTFIVLRVSLVTLQPWVNPTHLSGPKFLYRTRAIITRGLYFFYPLFIFNRGL